MYSGGTYLVKINIHLKQNRAFCWTPKIWCLKRVPFAPSVVYLVKSIEYADFLNADGHSIRPLPNLLLCSLF